MNVCAIVLDYRRAELTAACVRSLAGQVRRVVVVDNSDDAAHSDRLTAALRTITDPPVTRLLPGRNLGFAAGVNHALRAMDDPASCQAFLLLNNDACLGPGAVAALGAALREHGNQALVSPARTDDGAPLRLWYHRWLGLVTARSLPGAFDYLSGTCLLVGGDTARGGLFDEDFFMYGEDAELAWRLRRAGLVLATVAGVRISHVGNASQPPGGAFYEHHTARAHVLLARKLARNRAQALLFLACRGVVLAARAAVRAIRLRTLAPVSALASAWRT